MAADLIREAGVVFEARCDVVDVVLGFDDGLASVLRFDLGELRELRADLSS